MRLLVISAFWPTPANPIKGIFVVQQVRAYVEAGCEVTVLVPLTIRGYGVGREHRIDRMDARVFRPRFIDVPQSVAGGRRAMDFNAASCASAIRRSILQHHIDPQFDGVHVHEVRYGGLSYPTWGAPLDCPTVLTLHGIDPFMEQRATRPWFSQTLAAMWQRLAHVTVVGRPLLGYATSLGAPAERLSVVHNGTELPPRWQATQRPRGEKRVVLSVSNLVELKGIDLNLRALAAIKRRRPDLQWEYRIVGDGPERHSLMHLAQELGLADQTRFLGRLDHEATLEEMSRCDLFCLPSWGESFGIVYLEAMSRGRPVIGCLDWGAAEMVRDGTDGRLVQPRDEGSLTAALMELLADPGLCANMGECARQQSLSFSWGTNVRQYLAMFERLRRRRACLE